MRVTSLDRVLAQAARYGWTVEMNEARPVEVRDIERVAAVLVGGKVRAYATKMTSGWFLCLSSPYPFDLAPIVLWAEFTDDGRFLATGEGALGTTRPTTNRLRTLLADLYHYGAKP